MCQVVSYFADLVFESLFQFSGYQNDDLSFMVADARRASPDFEVSKFQAHMSTVQPVPLHQNVKIVCFSVLCFDKLVIKWTLCLIQDVQSQYPLMKVIFIGEIRPPRFKQVSILSGNTLVVGE